MRYNLTDPLLNHTTIYCGAAIWRQGKKVGSDSSQIFTNNKHTKKAGDGIRTHDVQLGNSGVAA